jgi:uncharacterized protein YbaA (DUF1428 family)
MPERYVDIYLLPVHEADMESYREQATTFGRVAREHGAHSYREFRAEDLGEGFTPDEGQVLTAAVAEFDSRSHRDEVMEKVLADPRVKALEGHEVADMSQMRYGGFETLVDA